MKDPHIPAKKSLGQNFLTDPHYLLKIVDAAHLGSDDQVLEIGPGRGHLTRELCSRVGKLLIIELDHRLIPVLRNQFGGDPRIQIVHGDALAFDFGALQGQWKVVANLPYYIATPLIERLLRNRRRFLSLTVMLQREVAERLAAAPGGKEYGYLSVLVQYHADVRIDLRVPAGAFTPRPKVDSAVATLSFPAEPRHAVQDETFLFRVVSAAFGQRRKTLRNSLGALGLSRNQVETAAASAGIDLVRRPETLTVAEFCALADALADQVQEIQGARETGKT